MVIGNQLLGTLPTLTCREPLSAPVGTVTNTSCRVAAKDGTVPAPRKVTVFCAGFPLSNPVPDMTRVAPSGTAAGETPVTSRGGWAWTVKSAWVVSGMAFPNLSAIPGPMYMVYGVDQFSGSSGVNTSRLSNLSVDATPSIPIPVKVSKTLKLELLTELSSTFSSNLMVMAPLAETPVSPLAGFVATTTGG